MTAHRRKNAPFLLAAIAVTVVIGVVYWPVRNGGFIWDDTQCFHDAAWLRSSNWMHYLFRDFCDWTDYFRPLVVALYTLQVRLFDSAPGPMHLVSLAFHIANTFLVGLLARKLDARSSSWGAVAAMLIYGLHPALIEPVFWVGCQYEMIVVLFTLLGLLANASIESSYARAAAVAGCFFLAACAKESAAAFPLVLLVADLSMQRASAGGLRTRLLEVWRRQRLVYASVLAAGIVYLALRHWAIGSTATPLGGEPLLSAARLHKSALAYVSYWKLMVWPMTGLSPIHPVDANQLGKFDVAALLCTAAAATIAVVGAVALARRLAIGSLIVSASFALLPVLHLVPVQFNESLYHERYAMMAIALACAWLPAAAAPLVPRLNANRVVRSIGLFAVIAWLILAVVNIRVTLPLWSDELLLWQWALRDHPNSTDAKQHLLAKYIERGDRAHANALADALLDGDTQCPVCMLSIAYFALGEGNAARAAVALDRISNGNEIPKDPLFLEEFIIAHGELLELQGDPTGAAAAYRDAMTIDPLDARPRMNLAFLLLRQGDAAAARATAEEALALYPLEERARRRSAFESAAAKVKRSP